MVIVTGSVMIFQGWRLDPILLLSQLMLCFVAGAFALEAFTLRAQRPSSPPPPPPQLPKERTYEDPFFDDLDLPADSLPSPRPTADAVLCGESDEGWSVEGDGFYGEEERWSDWRLSEGSDAVSRRDVPSGEGGVLQAVEDWE